MLKRFKRAGVWALALSMAVTMTPASAFADVDPVDEAAGAEPDAVVQVDGEAGAEDVVVQGEDAEKSREEGEAEAKEQKKAGKEQKKTDDENTNPNGETVTLDTMFGLSMWHTVIPYVPAAYGEFRSYGDKNWDTGADPKLQPVEEYTLVDNKDIQREYAYFRNMPMIYWQTMQEFWDYTSKMNANASGDDTNNGDVVESIYKDHVSELEGADEPGYILERITSLTSPSDRPVYAIHMTAVDVTVTADDASKILNPPNYVPEPTFTATETLGAYPEELDAQMKMNKGTFGRVVHVEREPEKPFLPLEEAEVVKLIPLLQDNVTSWKRSYIGEGEDQQVIQELTGVLWYTVVNRNMPKDGNETIDLVNSGMMMGGGMYGLSANSEELNDVLTANSEVDEAIESGDIEAFADAIGTMSEDEVFDMSKISDPPLHLELAQGTLYVYDNAEPLPAKDGFVDKQMEATNLDSSYKTTVTMTLPVTDEEFDPEDYYRFSGSNFYYQLSKAYKMVREKVAANAEETVDAQGMSLRRYYNPLTAPKQHDTILPYSEIVMNLADGFTLPTVGGELDLSKLSLIDYQYFYEPEKPAEDDQNVDQLNAEGYGNSNTGFTDYWEDEWFETFQDYYKEYQGWFDTYVFNKVSKNTETGYYVRDLKGHKLSLNDLIAEEEDDPDDEEVIEFTKPVEMYGFGLKKKPRSGEDEVEANEEANGSEVDYDVDDFAYILVYLPEGIGSSKADKELAEEICRYNDEGITGPCMILVYTGFYAHSESIWNSLNPLHYFEFHFEETLNNVSTASGTHGSYDPYGEAGGSSIKVLKDATLYRPSLAEWGVREEAVPARPYPDDEYFRLNSLEDDEDEVEPQEKPEEFYIPTVSYTVPGGGGNSGGRTSGGNSATILEPEVPLAELPELNKADHVAYVIGYEDGTVRPENYITRAEVSTIFFRLLTDDSRKAIWSTSNSYTDTAATAWYNNAVSTLSNGGVLSGYTDGTFLPSGNITRAEFATIAARFDESAVDTSSVSFSDISGHWAENNIKRAAALGYITGYQDGSFKPNAPITRAEAMTLMNRVLGRDKITAAGLLDNMAKWSDNPVGAWYYVAVQEATNTHDYTIADGVETWTSILANRDWAALEKEWATGAEKGAEVFQPVEEETPAAETEEPAAEETPASEFEAGTEAEA